MPPWKVMKMNQFRRLLIEPQHPHLPLHQVCEGFGPFPVEIGWCSRQMRCGPSGVQYSPKLSDIMATRGVQVTPETVLRLYCIVLTGLGAKLDLGGATPRASAIINALLASYCLKTLASKGISGTRPSQVTPIEFPGPHGCRETGSRHGVGYFRCDVGARVI